MSLEFGPCKLRRRATVQLERAMHGRLRLISKHLPTRSVGWLAPSTHSGGAAPSRARAARKRAAPFVFRSAVWSGPHHLSPSPFGRTPPVRAGLLACSPPPPRKRHCVPSSPVHVHTQACFQIKLGTHIYSFVPHFFTYMRCELA